ncbi:MAG: acylphosphatase [Phycisphaerales bacterium]|nr:acylphosphatase [Phycisphaerales bacterium]
MATRATIRYSGRVQGVFFRATTQSISRGHDVTGWVRNEADGSVLLVAEGEDRALQAFLDEIADQMRGNITDADITHQPATGEFTTFEIRG